METEQILVLKQKLQKYKETGIKVCVAILQNLQKANLTQQNIKDTQISKTVKTLSSLKFEEQDENNDNSDEKEDQKKLISISGELIVAWKKLFANKSSTVQSTNSNRFSLQSQSSQSEIPLLKRGSSSTQQQQQQKKQFEIPKNLDYSRLPLNKSGNKTRDNVLKTLFGVFMYQEVGNSKNNNNKNNKKQNNNNNLSKSNSVVVIDEEEENDDLNMDFLDDNIVDLEEEKSNNDTYSVAYEQKYALALDKTILIEKLAYNRMEKEAAGVAGRSTSYSLLQRNYTSVMQKIINHISKHEQFRYNVLYSVYTPEQVANQDDEIFISEEEKKELEKVKEKEMILQDPEFWARKMRNFMQNCSEGERCRFCKKMIAYCKMEKQTRSSDEPMTRFMRCEDCNRDWRD